VQRVRTPAVYRLVELHLLHVKYRKARWWGQLAGATRGPLLRDL